MFSDSACLCPKRHVAVMTLNLQSTTNYTEKFYLQLLKYKKYVMINNFKNKMKTTWNTNKSETGKK
jgi:hypothetical protein